MLPPLSLTHLTALTALSSDGLPLLLQERDALPATLRVLCARDCASAAPLLSLTALTRLELTHCSTPGTDLEAIGHGLPALTDVSLTYADMAAAAAAASSWACLPLRSLEFRAVDDVVPLETLQQLSRLSGLHHLRIHGGGGCCCR
jgi:hypothetical protein